MSVTYGPLRPLFTKQRIYVFNTITKHLCVVPLYKNMVCKIQVKSLQNDCFVPIDRIEYLYHGMYYVPHYACTICGIIKHW